MQRIGIIALGLAGLAILLSLGTWQVRRLAWKESVLAEIEMRISAPAVEVPLDPNPTEHPYLPVFAEGRFVSDPIRVLVSQKRIGAGYRLINAFEMTNGRRVMVDRGFVSVNDPIPETPQPNLRVIGNLHWPQERDGWTPENDLGANIWYARDVPVLAAALDAEPILMIARSIGSFDEDVTPIPVSTDGIPNDHLQYAVTWFSLAAIWLFMTLYFLYRARQTPDEGP